DRERQDEQAKREILKRVGELDELITKRAYDEAVKLLTDLLAKATPEIKEPLERLRLEVLQVSTVLKGAMKPDLEALKAQKKEVDLDVGKSIHGILVRAANGRIAIRVPGGGESEYAVATLPAKSIAKLFDLAHGCDLPEGALAKAFFLLYENE